MISYLRSSTHRLPYRPKLPSRYRLPHPPLLLPHPYLWPHFLTCASLPLLYSQPHITSPTAMHIRYAHHRFHRLQSLPSPQHPQRLPSLGYPSICLLLVNKNTSHRKWYNMGQRYDFLVILLLLVLNGFSPRYPGK